MATSNHKSWFDDLSSLWSPRVITLLFLGFSAGLPFFLIFSSLSLWLREAGVDRAELTYFSWAALGYSFKFIWAPLVGKMPIPFLSSQLGQRRSWLLLSQFMIAASLISMAMTDPATSPYALNIMAVSAVALGFSAATQDIVIDAYRIESGDKDVQALMSSMYITGYRLGILASGAGALVLADELGSSMANYSYPAWQTTYLIMCALMLIGVVTTLLATEPKRTEESLHHADFNAFEHVRLLFTFVIAVAAMIAGFQLTSAVSDALKAATTELLGNKVLSATLIEGIRLLFSILCAYSVARLTMAMGFVNRALVQSSYLTPIQEFIGRYSSKQVFLLFALIALYRTSDIVLGVIANVFYLDMGFSKSDIAAVVKTFGLIMSLLGGVLGGLLALRIGILPLLFLGGLLSAATNLLFMLLSSAGNSIELLYLVIAADNLSAGIATVAFVAFLSSLVNISFTTMQYAIFSSIMTLFPKILGGYSGTFVDTIGYSQFFFFTFLLGIPVLIVILALNMSKHFSASLTASQTSDIP